MSDPEAHGLWHRSLGVTMSLKHDSCSRQVASGQLQVLDCLRGAYEASEVHLQHAWCK